MRCNHSGDYISVATVAVNVVIAVVLSISAAILVCIIFLFRRRKINDELLSLILVQASDIIIDPHIHNTQSVLNRVSSFALCHNMMHYFVIYYCHI